MRFQHISRDVFLAVFARDQIFQAKGESSRLLQERALESSSCFQKAARKTLFRWTELLGTT